VTTNELAAGNPLRYSNVRVEIKYRNPADLILDPTHPNEHSERQIRGLRKSIREFGFYLPAVIDPTLRVVVGVGRVIAAIKEGLAELPVIQIDHLSPEQLSALRIADNQLAKKANWNRKFLGRELKTILELNIELDIEALGFDLPEIDGFIAALDEAEGSNGEGIVELTEARRVVAAQDSRWVLGKHHLLCADASNPDSLKRLLRGSTAKAAFTDPPYNVAIANNVSGLGAVQHENFVMGCNWTPTEFTAFLKSVLQNLADNSVPGAVHYIAMDWRHLEEISVAGREVYGALLNVCVWVKSNGGMGSFYRSRHEFIFVFKVPGDRHVNNVQLGKFGRNRTNVWEYDGANTLGRSDEGNLLHVHPTVKPLKMVMDAILDCTARSDIVLDIFLGSGTTLIACERTGRRCYGLELDPKYVDAIIRRWQAYTGGAAINVDTGKTFDQMAAELMEAGNA
jgi:DNA modification methylase